MVGCGATVSFYVDFSLKSIAVTCDFNPMTMVCSDLAALDFVLRMIQLAQGVLLCEAAIRSLKCKFPALVKPQA